MEVDHRVGVLAVAEVSKFDKGNGVAERFCIHLTERIFDKGNGVAERFYIHLMEST